MQIVIFTTKDVDGVDVVAVLPSGQTGADSESVCSSSQQRQA